MANNIVGEIKTHSKYLLQKYIDENQTCSNTLFTNNSDAIFVINLDGYYVKANTAFMKLSGYTVEDINQMTFQSLVFTEDLDKYYNYFHLATLGQFHNFDCKIKNSLGQIFELNIMHIPINVDDTIVGVYVVAKDITQLKRKKAEVRKIEEFHRLLTENILDIIITTNVIGTILYVSPSCEHILGYSPDELVGQHFSALIDPHDEKVALNHNLLLTTQQGHRDSYRFRKKDGMFVWLESLCKPIIDSATNNVVEIVSVLRDITEQRKTETELWNRKRAFRDLVEHSPDAIIIAKKDKIKFINETGINLLRGSKAEDFINRNVLDFLHLDYHKPAKERMEKNINGETTKFIEYKIVRMDSTVFDAQVKGIPTFFQNENCQHIIIRDITERNKTQELLLNSEKLNIAGQLAAGIAHEVRNPLTAIKGFLQLMEQPFDKKAYFDIIHSEIDRIELILSELLVLAKPQQIIFRDEQISILIQDVKTLIDTHAIMNNIQIDIKDNCKDLTIRCDKNQLKQVFINFVKNAIEAMPKGGTITIEITQHSVDKVKIIFKDTGIGIPVHILKRLGEPFFTTKENGTGLGIMISKKIVENHNGNVHFWSDEKGTIIEVILPLI